MDVVADHAADLFHQIVLDRDVLGGAPGGNGHREDVAARVRRRRIPALPESRAPRPASMARPSLRCSQSSGSAMGGGARQRAVRVGQAADQADAGRDFLQQFDGARQAADACWPDPAPFRSAWRRRCAASAATTSCGCSTPGNSRSRARCAWCVSEMALSRAADHAGDGDRAAGVGDHQVGRVERVRARRSARRSTRPRAPGGRRSCRRAAWSRSKACIGCASSAMMKFVTSTMLLIGFRPIASSRYCSHSGEGCTVTFSNTSAV